MQSRGTTTSKARRLKKLPPAQLEAAIKRLEEAGKKATGAEKKARISADIRNLRVLAKMRKIERRGTKGSAENPVK